MATRMAKKQVRPAKSFRNRHVSRTWLLLGFRHIASTAFQQEFGEKELVFLESS